MNVAPLPEDGAVTPIRIAFLLSGSGTTLENLLRHIDMGTVPGRVVVVLSVRAGVRGLDRARARGVPALVVERRAYRDGAAFDAAVMPLVIAFVAFAGIEAHADV